MGRNAKPPQFAQLAGVDALARAVAASLHPLQRHHTRPAPTGGREDGGQPPAAGGPQGREQAVRGLHAGDPRDAEERGDF